MTAALSQKLALPALSFEKNAYLYFTAGALRETHTAIHIPTTHYIQTDKDAARPKHARCAVQI